MWKEEELQTKNVITLASVFACEVTRIQNNAERRVENDGGQEGKCTAQRLAAHRDALKVVHLVPSSGLLPMVAETPLHPKVVTQVTAGSQGGSHSKKGRADRIAELDQTPPEAHFTRSLKSPLLLGFLSPEPDSTLTATPSLPLLFSYPKPLHLALSPL